MRKTKIISIHAWSNGHGFTLRSKHGFLALSFSKLGYAKVIYHLPHLASEIFDGRDLAFLVGRYFYFKDQIKQCTSDGYVQKVFI